MGWSIVSGVLKIAEAGNIGCCKEPGQAEFGTWHWRGFCFCSWSAGLNELSFQHGSWGVKQGIGAERADYHNSYETQLSRELLDSAPAECSHLSPRRLLVFLHTVESLFVVRSTLVGHSDTPLAIIWPPRFNLERRSFARRRFRIGFANWLFSHPSIRSTIGMATADDTL